MRSTRASGLGSSPVCGLFPMSSLVFSVHQKAKKRKLRKKKTERRPSGVKKGIRKEKERTLGKGGREEGIKVKRTGSGEGTKRGKNLSCERESDERMGK